jgi:4-hydroxybenzoate polyprenyltransferase
VSAGEATGRLRVYFAEMYPLPLRVATAAFLGASFTRLLARTHGGRFAPASAETARAAAAVFTVALVLRLMDELKDRDVDRALFPSRPLPSGRVRVSDIVACLGLAVLAWVALHVGSGPAALSAAAVLAYALLMFRWFFAPGWMRPRLLATLATHTPVVPLMLLHLAVLFATSGACGGRLRPAAVALLVGQYWGAVFAWEIARKIRAPEEEGDYVTYSRRLGRGGAVVLAGAAQSVSVAAGAALTVSAGLRPAALVVLLGGLSLCGFAYARFLLRPVPAHSRLQPFAEAFSLATCAWGLLA